MKIYHKSRNLFIKADMSLCIDLANEVEISSESCRGGLTQDLIMLWIAAKFLLLLLLMSNSRNGDLMSSQFRINCRLHLPNSRYSNSGTVIGFTVLSH